LEEYALKNIYVGNLPFQTTEQDLDQAFSAYGQVERVQIVKDRETGQARGFAFVEMPVDAEADRAMAALNGADLGGRTLTVNEARPREPRSGGGGGGGRGGFGGGGGGRPSGGGGRPPRREPRW
jgi:RNA recognition motif-containing protein